jgi:Kef-type K+ transport system membrane component KefB
MNIYYEAAIWIGLALLASVVSIRIAVPVTLVEIVVGAIAGNLAGIKEHVSETDIITLLPGVGSIMLTFLAGAEIDPVSLKRHWKASLSIGVISFALPFLAAFTFCYYVLGWHLHAAEIGGIALSTTSAAVVYAVMVETGLNRGANGPTPLCHGHRADLRVDRCPIRLRPSPHQPHPIHRTGHRGGPLRLRPYHHRSAVSTQDR